MPARRRSPSSLRVVVVDRLGRRVVDPGVGRWLASIAPRHAVGVATVVLVGAATMRRLNRTFAGEDRPTDVLAFRSVFAGAGPRAPLGDIVIARDVAARQARAAGHSRLTELCVLALHGLLHLLGYDHHADDGTMARLERRLRRRGGLREGLIERLEP